jgi:gas vesicle protein
MRNQTENQNEKMECRSNGAAFPFLVAGLGIGAALSVFLAPKSGAETRQWIVTKCLDGVDAANVKVRQARARCSTLVDQGQQRLSKAVIARREAVGKAKAEVAAS